MEKKEILRQQPFFYWLCSIQGIGDKTIKALCEKTKVPEEIYYAEEKIFMQWLELGILKKNQLYNVKKSRQEWNLYSEYEKLGKKGILFYPFYHNEYPKKLLQIPDYPVTLFVRGKLPEDTKKSVAIIGARNCTLYGKKQAEIFASSLAKEGVQIISGMARGIDGIAQCAAIHEKGASFGVLGNGVDVCYPSENQSLYRALWEKGGLISTYLPGTQPRAQNFPPRNRIISGLSDIVLVIEARERSGTWITVDMALEQGREVFALPGRVGDVMSEGCNRLISQGAGIALSKENIFESLHIQYNNKTILEDFAKKVEFQSKESVLLALLDVYPKGIETIQKEAEQVLKETISISETMQILMKLCLKGVAMQKQGGLFLKT